jgi:hypothetical protein
MLEIEACVGSGLVRLLLRPGLGWPVADLECRSCVADNRAEAEIANRRIFGLRQTARCLRFERLER